MKLQHNSKRSGLASTSNAQSDLVAAVLADDKEKEEAARESLSMFSEDFGNFLGTATEGNLPAEDAIAAVKGHEEQVLKAFDDYLAEDYDASTADFREDMRTCSE